MEYIFMWLALMTAVVVLPEIIVRRKRQPFWKSYEREIAKHIRRIDHAR